MSRSFHVMRFAACLMVMAGHFFTSVQRIWVPVTAGLIVFAFSSGFFTAIKHPAPVNGVAFWKGKLRRLGIPLMVVNLFLFCMFYFQGRSHIFSVHTLVNLMGLNGLLNWLRIPDPSPFGNGMWFFTLLLVFYGTYPFIARTGRQTLLLLTLGSLVLGAWLNQVNPYGHALYITGASFLLGVCAGRHEDLVRLVLGKWLWTGISVSGLCLIFWSGSALITYWLVLAIGMAGISWGVEFDWPDPFYRGALFFSGALLEIYLIHSYTSVSPIGVAWIDFFCSVVVTLVLGKILSTIRMERVVRLLK